MGIILNGCHVFMLNSQEDGTRIKLVTLCQEMHRYIVKVSQDFLQVCSRRGRCMASGLTFQRHWLCLLSSVAL